MSIHRRGDRNGYRISFTYKFPDGSKRRVREASQHTNKREHTHATVHDRLRLLEQLAKQFPHFALRGGQRAATRRRNAVQSAPAAVLSMQSGA